MANRKIIIGIHGLANKPPKSQLQDWWRAAMDEGLRKNLRYTGAFRFELVFWADYLYKNRLHTDTAFRFDELFNDEPYYEARKSDLKVYNDGILDDIRGGALGLAGTVVDSLKKNFGMDALADRVLSKFLKDLAYYYDENQTLVHRSRPGARRRTAQARQVLQADLRKTLQKHKGKQIMLIAHSMGSIIAYDVLRDIGRSRSPADRGIRIQHFVTIGSPLGLPHVRAKIMQERNYAGARNGSKKDIRTPSIVTGNWVNFADKHDPVSLDVHLADDYYENAAGVGVSDDLVYNSYRKPEYQGTVAVRNPHGKANHHKSYGYLRAPELSRHIRDFLKS